MLLTWMEVDPVPSSKITFSLIIHQITGKSPKSSLLCCPKYLEISKAPNCLSTEHSKFSCRLRNILNM